MKKSIAGLVTAMTVMVLPGRADGSVGANRNNAATAPPNIIVVLVDDMGYSDLGCMGSEIRTPNLDRMAREGLLFTHCYNTSRCCPTRAALLTGQYQWDAGVGHMNSRKFGAPEYQGFLNRNCATIAELLKAAGYRTFMAGKWHIGDRRDHWPDRRGFDEFYGVPAGGGLYFYPSKFYKRDVFRNGEKVEPGAGWYSTDAFTDAAIGFIRQQKPDQPFFIYLAYIAPHFPLQAKPEDIDKYRDAYTAGYEAVRNARFEKQQRLGIVPSELPASASTVPGWDEVENREQEALKMAVYAAQVDCLDQNIGRLLSTVEKQGLVENTVILFMSDNGASLEDFNKTPDAELGSAECNATYGKWFNVSNVPYRMGKKYEHEGGIISPMILHWPAGIRRPGETVRQPVHVMDVMPFCLELAGAEYPQEMKGHQLDPLDGTSFLPLLRGHGGDRDRLLYWEHQGNRAVRQGDWKLVAFHQREWELYNLADDPYETRNLISAHPEKAANLRRLYEQWAEAHGVRPWPMNL